MTEQDFCQMHNIKVIDTNKRFYRYQPLKYNQFFNYPNSMDAVDKFDIVHDTERLLTIEIPEKDFERICEFQSQVFNHMSQKGHYNLFETLIEQKENEKFLRDKYAAVQKAYEHYSMMLKLANSGELDLPHA